MEIYKKLAQVKAEIGTLKKNAKNPHFKNTYIDLGGLLDAVEPLLEKFGLILLQPITDGKVTTSIIDVENGESVTSNIELPNNQNPQQLGSAITYFRRYTLQSLLGLSAEDDDGQTASAPKRKTLLTQPAASEHIAKKTTLEALKTLFEVTKEQEDKYLKALNNGTK